MNLNKSKDYFNPEDCTDSIHIIGCGAIGSTIAEGLTRLGIKQVHLYDFDNVCAHNITNQMFWEEQIGMPKVNALEDIIHKINPEVDVITHYDGWTENTPLSGYVFLCVDNIETRQKIVKTHMLNKTIKAFFDLRMRLTDAQHFAASWNTPNDKPKKFFLETMNFTHEEAKESTPVSACGTTLSVFYTVRVICSYAIANFVQKVTTNTLYKTVLIDTADFNIEAFDE